MIAPLRVQFAEAIRLLKGLRALLDRPTDSLGMVDEVENLEFIEDVDEFLARWEADVLLEVANED